MMTRRCVERELWKPRNPFLWRNRQDTTGRVIFISRFHQRCLISREPGTPRKGYVFKNRKGSHKPFEHPWHGNKFMGQIPF